MENEVIIKDENGNDLRLVAVDAYNGCDGCHFNISTYTNYLAIDLPPCIKELRKDKKEIIFVVAETNG